MKSLMKVKLPTEQIKRNKGKKLKCFNPNAFSLILIDACGGLLNDAVTAEEAMSLLHTGEGKSEINRCLEAGF